MRIDADQYFLRLAELVSLRGTCARRQVGCVLVDHNNFVLATGYNGVAKGVKHCTDNPCPGANQPSGQGLHLCEATHAEANALIQCRDINAIHTAYVTASPCIQCTRLLMSTSCKRVVFAEVYPHSESERLWKSTDMHRVWNHVILEPYND